MLSRSHFDFILRTVGSAVFNLLEDRFENTSKNVWIRKNQFLNG